MTDAQIHRFLKHSGRPPYREWPIGFGGEFRPKQQVGCAAQVITAQPTYFAASLRPGSPIVGA